MTHAPMKPFYALIKNSTGRIVSYEFEKPQATSGWQDSVTDGTHRIERIGGEQAVGERRIVSMCPLRNQSKYDNLIIAYDDGSIVLVDGLTVGVDEQKYKILNINSPIPQPTPAEPAQDSELVRQLRGIIEYMRKDMLACNDLYRQGQRDERKVIANVIDAILSNHARADA